ncbi:MAG TPA: hypothetical protein VGL91_23460 [Acidobacteriota bacterium]|jgi:hypothetical protein
MIAKNFVYGAVIMFATSCKPLDYSKIVDGDHQFGGGFSIEAVQSGNSAASVENQSRAIVEVGKSKVTITPYWGTGGLELAVTFRVTGPKVSLDDFTVDISGLSNLKALNSPPPINDRWRGDKSWYYVETLSGKIEGLSFPTNLDSIRYVGFSTSVLDKSQARHTFFICLSQGGKISNVRLIGVRKSLPGMTG